MAATAKLSEPIETRLFINNEVGPLFLSSLMKYLPIVLMASFSSESLLTTRHSKSSAPTPKKSSQMVPQSLSH